MMWHFLNRTCFGKMTDNLTEYVQSETSYSFMQYWSACFFLKANIISPGFCGDNGWKMRSYHKNIYGGYWWKRNWPLDCQKLDKIALTIVFIQLFALKKGTRKETSFMNICFYYLYSKIETARTGEILNFFSELVYGTRKRFLTTTMCYMLVLHASANMVMVDIGFIFLIFYV